MTTLNLSVITGSDDAHETSAGAVSTSAAQSIVVDSPEEWIGLKFDGITIAPGSTIDSCTFSCIPTTSGNDEPNHTIYCEDVDNASTFTTATNDISGRARTTATALWSSTDLGADGTTRHNSVDFKSSLQEVIDRGGWASNNSAVVLVQGSSTATRDLAINMYNAGASLAAGLDINYTAGGSLTANNISTGAPTVAQATLSQVHVITGNGVATAAPTIAQANLSQVHLIAANNINTAAPTIENPAITEIVTVTANGIATGAPTIDNGILNQIHVITSNGIDTGAPTIANASLTQTYGFVANGIDTNAPTIDLAQLLQVHVLNGNGIVTGAPTIDEPTLGIEGTLIANNIVTGSPTIGNPALQQSHVLNGNDIITGAPTIGEPAIGGIHAFSANDIISGAPTIGMPVLNQSHVLIALDILTGIPEVSMASFSTEFGSLLLLRRRKAVC